jgi:hypothetical protein
MRARLYGRAFFVLKERSIFVISDILRLRNMKNYLKGGCYYG